MAGAILGGLGFLLIVEFGLSAGQVHHGVTVSGFEVGGMTLNELEDSLREREQTLGTERVCFFRDDLTLCVTPDELGWRVQPNLTAQRAYQVGRTDFPLGALGERVAAWVDGVNVKWEGGPASRQSHEAAGRVGDDFLPARDGIGERPHALQDQARHPCVSAQAVQDPLAVKVGR